MAVYDKVGICPEVDVQTGATLPEEVSVGEGKIVTELPVVLIPEQNEELTATTPPT